MTNPSIARRRQRGFTLTEIAIALGVIGLILSAIWTAATSVGKKETANQATEELQTIEQNMATLYPNRTSPAACAGGNDITDTAVKAGVIPTQYIYPSMLPCAKAGQPWHTAENGLTIDSLGPHMYNINFWDIPVDGCISLLLEATACDPAQAGCPIVIGGIGTFSDIAPNPGPPKNWQNITPAQAAAYCQSLSAYTGGEKVVGTNLISFEYAN